MKPIFTLPFIFAFILFGSNSLYAQITAGGMPMGLDQSLKLTALPEVLLASPEWNKIREEDKGPIGQIRFAVPIECSIDPLKDGAWTTLPGGDRIWRLKIRSSDALGLMLAYEQFHLAPGVRLFMYQPDGKEVFGAYTAANNSASYQFITGMVHGESAIVELYEPAGVAGQSHFRISRAYHAYRNDALTPAGGTNKDLLNFGFGTSLACHININCPQGANWQTEKRGVVRIRMVLQEGIGWCSGSLVNNTSNDGTPYVLSAYHCDDGYTPIFDMWTFYFHYESADCNNPTSEPAAPSLVGCQLRASRQETDFLLLQMSSSIPPSYNAYFNGWNRATNAVISNSTMIHHPSGDIKKISIDNDPATIQGTTINWNNGVISPVNSHLKTIQDVGTYQVGSSGSPLFDQNHRIVGQLHGGSVNNNNPCIVNFTYWGRFSLSWDQGATTATRLKEWLDPGNAAPLTLNGIENPVPATYTLSGKVKTWWNANMPNVMVILNGSNGGTAVSDTTYSDAQGNYIFSDVPAGSTVNITAMKDIGDSNGVTSFDMVKIRKQILGNELLGSPYRIIAGDANQSGSVSSLDMVQIQKVILNIDPAFTNNTSWRFVAAAYQFPDPNNPFTNNPFGITNIAVNTDLSNLDLLGIKIGDVNETANGN